MTSSSRHSGRFSALALVFALSACSEGGILGPDGDPASHPGMDTSVYPGDAVMRDWRAPGSPYEWTGYYLPAPCHRDSSWVGTRPRLAAMGWGFAVLYVGQQDWANLLRPLPSTADGPLLSSADAAQHAASETGRAILSPPASAATAATCSASLLSASQGNAEAADAIARAAAEGFGRGTVIYLDLEPVRTIAEPFRAYYRAWVDAVLRDGRFRPGIYTHRSNAGAIYGDVSAIWVAAGATGTIPFWVAWAADANGFSLDQDPAAAFALATVWQGRLDVAEQWAGHTVRIDVNVATSRSPSE